MKTKKTGLEMLQAIGKGMAKKHKASKPGFGPGRTAPMIGADLGGGMAQMNRGGNVGDWPYNFSKKAKTSRKHKSSKPKGPHGRAAVHALGRTKTTGNFKKIEQEKGKGAAIGAYQNALANHQGRQAPYGGKKSAAKKKESRKSYAHKGHMHASHKSMKAC